MSDDSDEVLHGRNHSSSDEYSTDHSSSDDEVPEAVMINNEVPEAVLIDGEERNSDDVEEAEDEEEEDEVVAAFISASSERNRNHPPNLFVGNVLIGGFSFHPNTNVIALGLSNGDISMYINYYFYFTK